MTDNDQSRQDKKVLEKLARLFVEIPDSADPAESEAELQAHGVEVARLGQKISKLVETAVEQERLAWLEEYRKEKEKGIQKFPRLKTDLPKTRIEKLRLLESLQSQFAKEGLPMAVGFKKLEELSDDDLAQIIAILQDESENPPGSK